MKLMDCDRASTAAITNLRIFLRSILLIFSVCSSLIFLFNYSLVLTSIDSFANIRPTGEVYVPSPTPQTSLLINICIV